MPHPARPSRRAPRALVIALLAVVAIALPAAAATVKPKPNGAFVTAFKKSGFAGIYVTNGKLTGGLITRRFTKKGKTCKVNANQTTSTLSMNFTDRTPGKPAKDGTFSFTAKSTDAAFTGAKAKFSGRFRSATRTSLTVSATWNGCKTGKVAYKTASFRSGG